MELRDYVRVLRKSWALILAVTIVGIGLGVGLTLITTKIYQASVQVFASSSIVSGENNALQQTNNFLSGRVNSYKSFATSPKVLDLVLADSAVKNQLKATHRTLTEGALAKKITADVPASTVLINLHVADTNPTTATVLANALGTAFDTVVPKTEQQIPVVDQNGNITNEVPAVQLAVIHPATVPSSPVKPNKVLNIGIGLVVGLLIGVAVAIVRELLDNTVKSVHDLEELGVPLLAQVAFDKRAGRSPIAFRSDAHSARSEAYRQLRTNLQFIDVDNPPRIISVTSPVPGEGKTTTAINLAAALAEAGGRVCLIEADLRRPSIAKSLGLVSDVGFTTVVIGKAPVETVLQNAGKNLAVLTCGPIPPNPSELLLSQHAKQVILDIAEKVDFVIIDTPPLLPVTDGAEIATIVDATLLVHRAGKTTLDQAARAIQALEKVGRRPVGVILNMVTRASSRYDYEYGYYYAAYRPATTATTATTATATKDEPTTVEVAPAAAKPDKKAAKAERKAAAKADKSADKSADKASGQAAAQPVEDTAPKGRRARHRDERRAAAAAEATTGPADLDTDSFTPVAERAAAAEAPAASSVEETSPVPAVPADVSVPTADEPAPVADEFADEFADEYDEYDDYDFDDEERGRAAVANDDTVEFGAIEVDGQEELPLSDRINGRLADDDGFDQRALDEALGVRGDDRR